MSSHAAEHDYHLLPPSPWPFLCGLAVMVWGVGMVVYFAGLHPRNIENPNGLMEFLFSRGADMFGADAVSNGGWIILLLGTLFGAYCMIGWWRDVIIEGNDGDHTPAVQVGLRYGMIMFLMQEAMFFVGWFWMFFEFGFFHKIRASWDGNVLENPESYATGFGLNGGGNAIHSIHAMDLPLINTLILLLSGTTVTWAHHALIHNQKRNVVWGLGLTILLGVFFTFVQGVEYVEAFLHRDTSAFWLDTNIYGSVFFMATGFHGLHVLIGAIFLLVMWLRALNNGLNPKQHFGFEAAAWYWHFVDVIWLFLFAFVYIAFAT